MNQRPRIDVTGAQGASEAELPLAVVGQHPRLDGLYRYWLGKLGGRRMPARRELPPEEMREFLGYIVLIDVMPPPRRFRFRLVGTEISSAYGRDMTGRYVDDIAISAYREMLQDHYSRATDLGQPVLHRLTFVEWPGKVHQLMRLAMPLSEDGGRVNMLMMASVFDPGLTLLRERQRAERPAG